MTLPRRVMWLVAAVAVIGLPLLVEDSLTRHQITNVFYFVIVATSLNVVSGMTGQLSVGHSGFVLIGAYASGIATTILDWPIWTGFVTGAILSTILAWVIGKVCLRLEPLYLAMVTLAAALILVRVAIQAEGVTGGQDGMRGIPNMFGEGDVATFFELSMMGVVAVGAVFVARNLKESYVGRAFVAVRDNALLASSCGVDVAGIRVRAFLLSGALAGIAGSLFGHWQGFVSPGQFGIELSLLLLLMMMVGGAGSVYGVAVGAAAMAVFPDLTRRFGEFHPYLYGGLLLGVAVFLPKGVAGLIPRTRHEPLTETEPGDIAKALPVVEHAEGEAVLEVVGLAKRFGGVQAVARIDMSIASGTIHCLIGPNGSGKTTTVNLITGFEDPDVGTIMFDGVDMAQVDSHDVAAHGVRRTFQTGRILTDLTVMENVLLGAHPSYRNGFLSVVVAARSLAVEEQNQRSRALAILQWLGLGDRAGDLGGELPAGHQRLTEVARVLMGRPRVILLDEPAAGLSATETAELSERLRDVCDRGVAILLIEHHLEFVMSIADSITVLDGGSVIADGAPAEVRKAPAVLAAYLGRDYVPSVTGDST